MTDPCRQIDGWGQNTWASPTWSRLVFVEPGSSGIRPHVVPRGVPKRILLRDLRDRYEDDNTDPIEDQVRRKGLIDVPGAVFVDIKWKTISMPTGHDFSFYPGHADILLYALENGRGFSGLWKVYASFFCLVIPATWVPTLKKAFEESLAESEAFHQVISTIAAGHDHIAAARPLIPAGDA